MAPKIQRLVSLERGKLGNLETKRILMKNKKEIEERKRELKKKWKKFKEEQKEEKLKKELIKTSQTLRRILKDFLWIFDKAPGSMKSVAYSTSNQCATRRTT
ncbi:hypothetical protein PIB30_102053 [Stylosanthes scabra]|uniref:Uncharacterized protein n=1 Tax=Stylosanthes scabra TaxID=79078 RepID=A0ABU6W0T0_9FABA|nr:hypothetical protein [Stylosanthes scabra]